MNFQIPQPDDDFDYYGNSSQDESRGSQGRQFVLTFGLELSMTNLILFSSSCKCACTLHTTRLSLCIYVIHLDIGIGWQTWARDLWSYYRC